MQNKAQQIANKMRDCMAKLKSQGVKFGFAASKHRKSRKCVDGAKRGVKTAAKVRTARANAAYQFLIPRVRELRKTMTWDKIRALLNEEGHLTTAGMPFNSPTLIRLMQRADGIKPKRRP